MRTHIVTMAPLLHHYLFIQLIVLPKGLSHLVRTQQVVRATLGEDAVLNCELMTPKNVRQVTWQKVTTEANENVATYSKRGSNVNPPFQGKVEFEDEGLQNCSIVIRGVSRGDECCYKCLFNTFPDGPISGRTCLQVNELYGPSLLITQTNNSHTTLSCSATGQPTPIVTWEDTEIKENSTMANVTHHNGTVTVTITSTLAAFSVPDKDIRVGCVVSLFSGGVTKNVSMVIPARNQASFPGEPEVTDGDRISGNSTVIVAVMGSLCFIAVCCGAAVVLWCKLRNTMTSPNPTANDRKSGEQEELSTLNTQPST
ncbi:OX-2 membrane glycoprotein-like isoform X1 [Salmo trutta]|uniref:OX-2 membrane glycoprotein-like isoform X1 n=1 Tax=Salmo trutta TaxID=8032 RepID=UPI001131284D|nr:OX-2 membrane glycoprotein-like isoform X1 [Salmo trutta]